MIKILSWKINSGVYAYIYPINDGKYISNRIPEDSPIWKDIIEIMSKEWDKNAYKTNFDAMNKELESKYGKTIEWDDKYWNFNDENYPDGINIVLLSGKDGVGVAGEGEKTDGDSENIDEIVQEIENKLNKAREEIEKKNEEVENFIEEKVSQTIANAQKTINETKEELSAVREELTEGLNSAKDALKKASELFDFNGEISQDDIIDAVSTTKEYGEWLEDYSEDLTSLKSDYDAAAKAMGSIGEAEDVSKGLFSKMATSISVVSGAVGTVESTMNASLGEIKDMATWYDTNKDDATEAIRLISASGAQIQDTIDFINGDGLTTHLNTIMDGKNADIKQEILAETDEYIGSVRREMNAMSGAIEDTIVRLSDETLTSMGDRMNAIDSEMEKWLTKFDELCGTTIDLRDTWTLESGKLSSIASLIPETDEYGNILYYVSSVTLSDNSIQTIPELEVVRVETDNIGSYLYMAKNKDEAGDLRDYIWKEAYMKLSSQMTSYIQQEVSSITFSIVNDEGLTAAIKLAITGSTEGDEEPIITMIAKEVVISADLIAGAISAVSANIGGIEIGNGIIKSSNNTVNQFILNGKDGTITANNVSLSGSVYATNGVFSGTVYATSGEFKGTVYAENGKFSGEINAKTGKIGGLDINENYLSYSGTIINSGNENFKDDKGNLFSLMCGFKEEYKLYEFKNIDTTKNIFIYMFTDDYNNKNTNVTLFYKEENKYCTVEGFKFIVSYNNNNLNTAYDIIVNGLPSSGNYGPISGSYKKTSASSLAAKYGDFFTFPFNFAVNENGEMFCKTLKSTNANITGYISAQGEFSGKLNNVNGNIRVCDIKDCDIENVNINKLAFPYTSKPVIRFDNNAAISTTGTSSSEIIINEIDEIIQNNTKSIKNVTESLKIFSFHANKNYNVTIPSFEITIERYAPGDTMHPVSTDSQFMIKSNGNTIVNSGFTIDPYSYGGTQKKTYTIGGISTTVNSEEKVTVTFHVSIPIGYSNYGVPYLRIKIKPVSAKYVKLTEKNETQNTMIPFNMLIGKNGVKIEYAYGRSIIINDYGIYLNNKKLNIDVMEQLGILT